MDDQRDMGEHPVESQSSGMGVSAGTVGEDEMKCVCTVCYRDFDSKGWAYAKYCSKHCEKVARRAAETPHRVEVLAPDGSILIDHGRVRISPVAEIEKEARAKGVSYGMLKAQKWLKETEVIF